MNVCKVIQKTIVRDFFNKHIIKFFEENSSLKSKFCLSVCVYACVCETVLKWSKFVNKVLKKTSRGGYFKETFSTPS